MTRPGLQVSILGTLAIGLPAAKSRAESCVELVHSIASSRRDLPAPPYLPPSPPRETPERSEPFYAAFVKRRRR